MNKSLPSTFNFITNEFNLKNVRRLRLRWNRSDLEGITEFKQLMDVVQKYEILAHMKLGEDGIEHHAEIIPEEGGLEKIDNIPTFDVLEIHEKTKKLAHTLLRSI